MTTKPLNGNTAVKRRDAILSLAMDVASSEGLEGLTIGRLSKLAGMSKSGLFAHFGSKEDLQLATVDHAKRIFRERVWHRASEVEPGIVRLRHMLRCWTDYIEGCGLRGGCFFAASGAEFDGRPGEVRDQLIRLIGSWIGYLEHETEAAMDLGHFDFQMNPERLTFELHAQVQEANLYRQLFGKEGAFDFARQSIDERLLSVATNSGKELLELYMSKPTPEEL
jgi:AcrR family transcriptional regulator